mgnify:CR=1 FL=1|tara:strand:- start:158 stop:364 length:207 start_codon:yes stop_codon:yes gene_type:complete
MENVNEMMEEILTTMEILKQIEKDIRDTPPINMTEEQESKFNALLDLISAVSIPDIHFLPTNQIVGEA